MFIFDTHIYHCYGFFFIGDLRRLLKRDTELGTHMITQMCKGNIVEMSRL